ncbi:hypothetical protein Godav_025236, partial [Gossypium davidsonii]|nr:hypothetical protein [Gossypium davidsonii]
MFISPRQISRQTIDYLNELDKIEKKLPVTKAHTLKSCSGIIARDGRSRILSTRAVKNENVPSPFAAEALACLQSLKLWRDLGLREVMVEGDSLSICAFSGKGRFEKGRWLGSRSRRAGDICGSGESKLFTYAGEEDVE